MAPHLRSALPPKYMLSPHRPPSSLPAPTPSLPPSSLSAPTLPTPVLPLPACRLLSALARRCPAWCCTATSRRPLATAACSSSVTESTRCVLPPPLLPPSLPYLPGYFPARSLLASPFLFSHVSPFHFPPLIRLGLSRQSRPFSYPSTPWCRSPGSLLLTSFPRRRAE